MLFALRSLALALFTAAMGVGATSHAADIYVVHGMPGQDLGQPAELPVDIAIDGVCSSLTNVVFGAVAPAGTLPAGEHAVAVSLAAPAPCTGELAASARFDLGAGESAVIVAHLDQNGAARVSKYSLRTTGVAMDRTFVQLVHAAAAPMVSIKLKGESRYSAKHLTPGLQTAGKLVLQGDYRWFVRPVSTGTVIKGDDLDFVEEYYYSVFVVGSLESDTLTVLSLGIPDVP